MINRRQLLLMLLRLVLRLRLVKVLMFHVVHLLNATTPVHVHIGRRCGGGQHNGSGRVHFAHLHVQLLLLAVALAASQIAVAVAETGAQLGATQLEAIASNGAERRLWHRAAGAISGAVVGGRADVAARVGVGRGGRACRAVAGVGQAGDVDEFVFGDVDAMAGRIEVGVRVGGSVAQLLLLVLLMVEEGRVRMRIGTVAGSTAVRCVSSAARGHKCGGRVRRG